MKPFYNSYSVCRRLSTLLLASCLSASLLHAQTTSEIGAGYFNGAVFANYTTPALTGAASQTTGPISGNLNGNSFTINFTNTAGLYNTYTSGTGTPAPGAAIYPNYIPGGMPANSGWPANNIPVVDLVWRTGLPGSGTVVFTQNLQLFDQMYIIDIDTREGVQFEFLDAGNTPLDVATNIRVVRLSSMTGSSSPVSYPTSTSVGINLNGSVTNATSDEGYAFVMLTNNVRAIRFTQTLNSPTSMTNSWDFTFSSGAPDRGDAPASYSDAAHFSLHHLLRLGNNGGDAEVAAINAVAPAAATGDDNNGIDDEDGTNPAMLTTSTATSQTVTYSVTATVTNNSGSAANSVAWIDWNNNGIFEASEGVSTASVPSGSSNASRTFTWTGTTLSGNAGTNGTYLRIRTSSNALTTGNASGYIEGIGEVEDYRVIFSSTMSVAISGVLYLDNNGMTGGANGTPYAGATVTLYAADGTTVLATTTTNASGTYTFSGITATGNLTVAVTPPAGYVNVSSTDATPGDGRTTVAISNANISGINFGIQQPPAANIQTYFIPTPAPGSVQVLNGTGASGSPGPLSGTDPEDGVKGSGATFTITDTSTLNGNQLLYNGVPVTPGTPITNYNPALLSVRYSGNGSTSLQFSYTVTDAAGVASAAAPYAISWSTPLPVQLTRFDAQSSKEGITLAWMATTEPDLDYFGVERSSDATSWTKVGQVAAIHNESFEQAYSYQDLQPLTGENYYRLRVNGHSGIQLFSETVKVNFTGKPLIHISLLPNPATGTTAVLCSRAITEKAELTLIDAMGRIVRQELLKEGTQSYKLDLAQLPSGIYMVRIESAELKTTLQLVKQ